MGLLRLPGYQIKEKENAKRNYDAAITVTAAQKPTQPQLNPKKETVKKIQKLNYK